MAIKTIHINDLTQATNIKANDQFIVNAVNGNSNYALAKVAFSNISSALYNNAKTEIDTYMEEKFPAEMSELLNKTEYNDDMKVVNANIETLSNYVTVDLSNDVKTLLNSIASKNGSIFLDNTSSYLFKYTPITLNTTATDLTYDSLQETATTVTLMRFNKNALLVHRITKNCIILVEGCLNLNTVIYLIKNSSYSGKSKIQISNNILLNGITTNFITLMGPLASLRYIVELFHVKSGNIIVIGNSGSIYKPYNTNTNLKPTTTASFSTSYSVEIREFRS